MTKRRSKRSQKRTSERFQIRRDNVERRNAIKEQKKARKYIKTGNMSGSYVSNKFGQDDVDKLVSGKRKRDTKGSRFEKRIASVKRVEERLNRRREGYRKQ